MKAIIILGLSTMVQTAFSQQQQQIQNRNILVNNLSNVNYVNVAVLSNIQVNFNNNEQKQQLRNISRATPVRRATHVRTNNTLARNATPQVRRRSRPRPRTVNTTPVNNPPVQVLNIINVPETNQMLAVNDINASVQNPGLGNGFDIQTQGVSNIANVDSNPFVQQKSNESKESLQVNTNLDLSLNLKGASVVRSRAVSSSSSSSSSSRSRSHTFSKKMAKFKRNFFGKLASHRKGNGRIDLCFNWNN